MVRKYNHGNDPHVEQPLDFDRGPTTIDALGHIQPQLVTMLSDPDSHMHKNKMGPYLMLNTQITQMD